ncbi:MAG: STAS domain-containing protein [Jatrophihabitantaceae bacterium]
MELTIAIAVTDAGRHTITLGGAIDMQSCPDLVSAGRAAVDAAGCSEIVLNLADVTFMDSIGIGAIVQLAGNATDAGLAFRLQDPSPRVMRILELTGLQNAWTIESVDTA